MNEIIELARIKNARIFRNNLFIKKSEVEGFRDKYNNYGIFVSAFSYETNNPDQGKLLGNFFLDFDSKEIEKAREDTIEVLECLKNKLEIDPNGIYLFFSGNKGFHLEIDYKAFGIKPNEKLAEIYRKMAEKLSNSNKTLDMKVYERRRLWRLERSKHEKSGLYKIRLTHDEAKEMSIERIKKLAQNPRIYPFKDKSPNASLKAKEFYEKCAKEIDQKITIEKEGNSKPFIIDELVPCIEKLFEGISEGNRNEAAFTLARFLKNKGDSEQLIKKTLLEWNKKNKPPLNEREIIITTESALKTEKDGIGCSSVLLKDNCDKENCSLWQNFKSKKLTLEEDNLIFEIKLKSKELVVKGKEGEILFEKAFSGSFWKSERTQQKIISNLYDLEVFKNRKEARKTVLRVCTQISNKIREMTTKSPKGDISEKLFSERVSLKEVFGAVSKIGTCAREMVELIMAVCISAKMKLPISLWLMVIGVPSSLKTELTKTLSWLPSVYYIDSMTQNPFASGYLPPDGSRPHDLLPELNGKCFICRDYTTLYSLNEETIKKLLGELIAIYDEEFTKYSPTRGKVSYKSRFSHIGCITPAALNKHQQYINMIGPRFLFYRVPKLSETSEKEGFKIAWNKENRKSLIENARKYVSSYCSQIIKELPNIEIKEENGQIQEKLNKLAKFMAKARGIVITKASQFKNEEDKWIRYYEVEDIQTEEPWRALLQLKGLSQALATIRGKTEISEEEITTLKQVVLSSMPVDRADALNVFRNRTAVTSKELAEEIDKSPRTAQRLLKELTKLGILDYESNEAEKTRYYFPVTEFSEIISNKEKVQEPEKEPEDEIDVKKLF